MKTIIILATALALTACNKAADAPAKPAASNDMASMDMSAAVKTGSGSGKITALDNAGGNITIDHGPIPAVGWSAMTMGFKADPKILEGVAVGDQVDFDLSLRGNNGTVTAITKR
jgi:Cu(I)/Ag(I) efflux system protein CusF